MKQYLISPFICALLLLLSLSSCGEPSLEITYEQEEVPVFVMGEVYDPADNSTSDVMFTFGPQEDESIHYSFQSAVFLNPEGERRELFVEVYNIVPAPFAPNDPFLLEEDTYPVFALHFATNIDDPSTEFESYFQVGTTFSVGEEIGEVEVRLRLPDEFGVDLPASRSSFLLAPEGTLEIVAMEDYEYEAKVNFNQVILSGKIVEATFSATIGRYDLEMDELDGVPGYTTTDEVQLQNFRVRFFVPLSE